MIEIKNEGSPGGRINKKEPDSERFEWQIARQICKMMQMSGYLYYYITENKGGKKMTL